MIYLNNNKINKLGGINRAYLNGRLIYQGYFGGVLEERVILSTTEVIVVDNGDGTYSFYEKYIKQTSTDGENWKDSGEYTQGNEVQATLNTIQDTLCVDGNKYSQKEYVATVDGNLINTGVIIQGDLIEENAEDCQFITDFVFNYNFNDYNNGVVPNHQNASWNYDLQLYGTPVIENDGTDNYLKVTNSDSYGKYEWESADENVFKTQKMTFIYKGQSFQSSDGANVLSVRWGYFNYMVRHYQDRITLHTACGEDESIEGNGVAVYAITFDGDTLDLKYYNLTEGTTKTVNAQCMFGEVSRGVTFFAGNASGSDSWDEPFTGNCYWMFVANRVLTKDEIDIVANFNGM